MFPTARLPENVPTPTNSIVLLVVLCLLVFGLMVFAKFMQRRERKRRDD
jgi:Sec-independent protein secretion pathway component TatC